MRVKLSEIIDEPISGEWGADDTDGTGIPVLRTTNFTNEGIIDYHNVITRQICKRNFAEKMLRYGDIIIEKSGGSDKQPVGRVVFFEGEENRYLFNNFTGLLRVKNITKWLPKYVFYALYSNYMAGGTLRFENRTTGLHNLQLNNYISMSEIPYTSVDDQKYIISMLDRVSDLILLRKQQITKLDKLIKSRFVEMFGDLVTNTKGLPILLLSEMSELITKGASPSWQGFSYTDDSTQTLFITSENVREGYIDISSPKYLEDGFNNKQKRSILKNGDFLINIVGASIGRAAQFNLDCKANINQAVALVRVNDRRLRDKYLLVYLNSDKAQQMYNSMKSDTGRANLSLQDIGNLLVLLPPIEQQIEFEQFIEQVDKSKSEIKQGLNKLETLKKALMQKYFG